MDTLSLLYSLNGMIIGAAFLPQIVALVRDQSGAVSTSITSWFIFTLVSAISLAYGVFKLHDTLFIACSAVSVAGNGIIMLLTIYRRQQKKAVLVRA